MTINSISGKKWAYFINGKLLSVIISFLIGWNSFGGIVNDFEVLPDNDITVPYSTTTTIGACDGRMTGSQALQINYGATGWGYVNMNPDTDEQPVIGNAKWISMWVRSETQHDIRMLIRESGVDDWTQFSTEISIVPGIWQYIILDISSTGIGAGKFRYDKSGTNGDTLFNPGKSIVQLLFAAYDGDWTLKIDDMEWHGDIPIKSNVINDFETLPNGSLYLSSGSTSEITVVDGADSDGHALRVDYDTVTRGYVVMELDDNKPVVGSANWLSFWVRTDSTASHTATFYIHEDDSGSEDFDSFYSSVWVEPGVWQYKILDMRRACSSYPEAEHSKFRYSSISGANGDKKLTPGKEISKIYLAAMEGGWDLQIDNIQWHADMPDQSNIVNDFEALPDDDITVCYSTTTTVEGCDGKTADSRALQINYSASGWGYVAMNPDTVEQPIIGDAKWLSMWVRSETQHTFRMLIRESGDYDWTQFSTEIDVEPGVWKYVVLDIQTTGTEAGRFRYNKKGIDGDTQFTPGKSIVLSMFAAYEGDWSLKIDDIKWHTYKPFTGTVASKPLTAPYVFDTVDNNSPIQLANGGTTSFCIAVPVDAEATVVFAAEELANYLSSVTGATFPVLSFAQLQPTQPRIALAHIGSTGYSGLGVTAPANSVHGFAMESVSTSNIAIVGGSPLAVLYGSYSFLEKAAGVRWFRPMAQGEVIPQIANLSIPMFDDEETPTFNTRQLLYSGDVRRIPAVRHYAVADWCVKNYNDGELSVLFKSSYPTEQERLDAIAAWQEFCHKRGIDYSEPVVPSGHNMHELISPAIYWTSNPEYYPFARADNEWYAVTNPDVSNSASVQLCATNSTVASLIASQAIAFFTANPDRIIFNVAQEDGSRRWCQCVNCLALSSGADGWGGDHATACNIYLANAVAALVAAQIPDKFISTYAYISTSTPSTLVQPRSDVIINYCNPVIGFLDGSVSEDRTCQDDFPYWAQTATTGNLMFRDYIYSNFLFSYKNEAYLPDDYRFYADQNAAGGIKAETSEVWGVSDFTIYLAARLSWDPWLNVEILTQDYFSKMYGPAATYMRSFHEHTQEIFNDHENFVRIGTKWYPCFTTQQLDTLEYYLDDAVLSTSDQVILERIAFKDMTLEYISLWSDAIYLTADTYNGGSASLAYAAISDLRAFLGANYQSETYPYLADYNLTTILYDSVNQEI